MSLKFFTLPEA